MKAFDSAAALTAGAGHVVCKLPWLHMVLVGLAVVFTLGRARCPLGLVLNRVACYKV